ncbi:MAG: ROK family protein [Verrucomicrobia bacterium]|nr:ROK family protein [Verrucomicrobiota bacterium]
MDRKYLGIEIGGTKLQIVLGDNSATILKRWRLPVDREKGASGIRQQIEFTLAEICEATALQGIGVGFGGPVDWQNGKISRSHQIEGWSEFALGDWLQSLTRLPVRVDNDANVAAFGEALHGSGKGFNPVFYVTLGSGVGGGLVVDGHIYHGAQPGESEIGHVRLDRAGTVVEERCSGWAVDAKIRNSITHEPHSLLSKLAGGQVGGEAKHLKAALEQGDAAAQKILAETAEDLAFGLSHVIHLFHPEIIIIGGGLSLLGEPIRLAVANAIGRCIMKVFAPGPRISLAALGEDAVPLGALVLARLLG